METRGQGVRSATAGPRPSPCSVPCCCVLCRVLRDRLSPRSPEVHRWPGAQGCPAVLPRYACPRILQCHLVET